MLPPGYYDLPEPGQTEMDEDLDEKDISSILKVENNNQNTDSSETKLFKIWFVHFIFLKNIFTMEDIEDSMSSETLVNFVNSGDSSKLGEVRSGHLHLLKMSFSWRCSFMGQNIIWAKTKDGPT